jgi:hypothetical protein
MLLSEGWWTRSQSIRTEGEVPFEVAIVDPPEVCQREPNNHPVWELNLHPPSYSRRETYGT